MPLSSAAQQSKLSIHTAFDNNGPLSWKFINVRRKPRPALCG